MSKRDIREVADDQFQQFDWVPVCEVIDLGVTAQTLSVTTAKFDYITLLYITYNMSDAAIEWTEFLVGGALTNGFQFYVDGRPFGDAIKTIGTLGELGRVFISPTDLDAATVSYVIQCEIDMTRICGNLGMQIQKQGGEKTLTVVVGDDMSGATGILSLSVFGYKVIA